MSSFQVVYQTLLPLQQKNSNYYLATSAKSFPDDFMETVVAPVIASSSAGSMWRTPGQISNMALQRAPTVVPAYDDYARNVTFFQTQIRDMDGSSSYLVVNDMPREFSDDRGFQRASGYAFVPPPAVNYQSDALLLPYPNANTFAAYGNTLRVGNTPGDAPNSSLQCLGGVYLDNLRCGDTK